VALAGALATAVAAGLLAMRSAFGLPTLVRTRGWDPTGHTHSQARTAYRMLRLAIWLTVVSIGALAAALAVLWYGPRLERANVLVVVPSSGLQVCGEVVRADATAVTLRTEAGERIIAWSSVVGVQPRSSCAG
jgi:hypothetical protein